MIPYCRWCFIALQSVNKSTIITYTPFFNCRKLSTALIQRGSLKKGSILVAGTAWAKVCCSQFLCIMWILQNTTVLSYSVILIIPRHKMSGCSWPKSCQMMYTIQWQDNIFTTLSNFALRSGPMPMPFHKRNQALYKFAEVFVLLLVYMCMHRFQHKCSYFLKNVSYLCQHL